MRPLAALALVLCLAPAAGAQDDCAEPRRLALFAGGNIQVTLQPCLDGEAHANGTAVFDTLNTPEICAGYRGLVTMGEDLVPPRLRVDPDAFPDDTYYFVKLVPAAPPYCLILARDGVTQLQGILGDSLDYALVRTAEDRYLLDLGRGTFRDPLDPVQGPFQKDPGDIGVVVNFAPDNALIPDIRVLRHPDDVLAMTLINARFVGGTEEERGHPNAWEGGLMTLLTAQFRPVNGLAFVAGSLQTLHVGPTVGSSDAPALGLVTSDWTAPPSQSVVHGSLVVLGNVAVSGGQQLVYDPGFYARLPQAIRGGFAGTCWDLETVAVRPVSWGSLKRGARGY